MNLLPHKIEVTARLELNRREIELLAHIFSFDNLTDFAKGVEHSTYGGGVSAKEALEFMKSLHSTALSMIGTIEDNKKKLFNK